MKKYLVLLLLAASLRAQTTTVSATVVDTDGTTWANGKWKIAFTPNPSQPNSSIYKIAGVPLNPAVMNQSGSLDGSGAFSLSVYQTAPIAPVGSSWTLTVCPNATSACGIYKFTAIGGSMNLSSALTPVIPAPRFHPVSGTYGYNDGEAILSLLPGSTYWSVVSSTQRCYTGSAWANCNGSGGGGGNVVGTLTSGYYPVASAAHALVDGTIEETGAQLNIKDPTEIYMEASNIQLDACSASLCPPGTLALYAGQDVNLVAVNGTANIQASASGQGVQISSANPSGTGIGLASINGVEILGITGTAGALQFLQGTDISTQPANTIELEAPASVTAYRAKLPGSAPADAVDYLRCTNATPSICDWYNAASGITELTGDVTAGPGSGSQAATLKTVNASPGSCGDASNVPTLTVNGKGLVTACTTSPISSGTDYYFTFTGCTLTVTGNSFNCHASQSFSTVSPVVPNQADVNYFLVCSTYTTEQWGSSTGINNVSTTGFDYAENIDRYNGISATVSPIVWCHLHHN